MTATATKTREVKKTTRAKTQPDGVQVVVKDLRKALSLTKCLADGKLNDLVLDFDGSLLTIYVGDSNNNVISSIKADCDPIRIVLLLDKFKQLIESVSGDVMTFDIGETFTTLYCGNFKLDMTHLEITPDLSMFDFLNGEALGEFEAHTETLVTAANRVDYAVSKADYHPNMHCVQLKAIEGKMWVAGVSDVLQASYQTDIDMPVDELKPAAKQFVAITKQLDSDYVTTISYDNSRIRLENNGNRFVCSKIEGMFPNLYAAVKIGGKGNTTGKDRGDANVSLTINKSEFKEVLKRSELVTAQSNNYRVRFTLDKAQLRICGFNAQNVIKSDEHLDVSSVFGSLENPERYFSNTFLLSTIEGIPEREMLTLKIWDVGTVVTIVDESDSAFTGYLTRLVFPDELVKSGELNG